MGILAAAFGKSVVSFPMHKHKTARFYQSIEEEGRCIPFDSISGQEVFDKMMYYADKPIIISREIRKAAYENIIQCIK